MRISKRHIPFTPLINGLLVVRVDKVLRMEATVTLAGHVASDHGRAIRWVNKFSSLKLCLTLLQHLLYLHASYAPLRFRVNLFLGMD